VLQRKIYLHFPDDDFFDDDLVRRLMRNKTGKVMILWGDVFYFAVFSKSGYEIEKIRETELRKPLLQQLVSRFNDIKQDGFQLADPATLRIITALLGNFLEPCLFRDSITLDALQQKFDQVKETHCKLAIVKINDVVGYGVVVLEDIPADTTVTFYAGKFRTNLKNRDSQDDYVGGNNRFEISAKSHRNFAGFMTHAFHAKNGNDSRDSRNVYLEDFMPHHVPEEEGCAADLKRHYTTINSSS
jgi:hypothetical protein